MSTRQLVLRTVGGGLWTRCLAPFRALATGRA